MTIQHRMIIQIPMKCLLPTNSRCPVLYPLDASLPRAERTTKQHALLILRTMAENPAAAMVACRGKRVDRAFEAVEDVCRSAKCDLKRLVVGVSTNFTGFHVYSSGGATF